MTLSAARLGVSCSRNTLWSKCHLKRSRSIKLFRKSQLQESQLSKDNVSVVKTPSFPDEVRRGAGDTLPQFMDLCKLFVAAWTWHVCSANPVSLQCHVLWQLLLAASWNCACAWSLPGELPYQRGGRAARSSSHNKGFLLWSGSPAVHGRDSEEDCKEEMIWLTGPGLQGALTCSRCCPVLTRLLPADRVVVVFILPTWHHQLELIDIDGGVLDPVLQLRICPSKHRQINSATANMKERNRNCWSH